MAGRLRLAAVVRSATRARVCVIDVVVRHVQRQYYIRHLGRALVPIRYVIQLGHRLPLPQQLLLVRQPRYPRALRALLFPTPRAPRCRVPLRQVVVYPYFCPRYMYQFVRLLGARERQFFSRRTIVRRFYINFLRAELISQSRINCAGCTSYALQWLIYTHWLITNARKR